MIIIVLFVLIFIYGCCRVSSDCESVTYDDKDK